MLLLGLFALSFLAGMMGDDRMLQAAYHLWTGWYHFMTRSKAQMDISIGGFLTAGICLILLLFVGHSFLAWLNKSFKNAEPMMPDAPYAPAPLERHWKFKWTLSCLVLTVTIFAAGISAVGIFHQIGWLAAVTMDETMVVGER